MPPSSSDGAPSVPDAALAELAAAYAGLDRELAAAGVACRACGSCCDFVRNDYRLYASRLERELVTRHHPEPRLTPAGLCGYLREGRCSVHRHRPLGCRTFFCDPAHKPREQALYHTVQRRLHAIAERHAVPWDYGPFFQDAKGE